MARAWTSITCLVLLCAIADVIGQELIANPDFEEAFDGDDWYCTSCTLTQDGFDSYTGSYSGRVTQR